jgi:16S rRNA (cytidine1402-2'-O)-methyltransferase
VTRGRLVLVGTPIGNLGDLSPRAVAVLTEADVVAAEDTRRTRALLSAAGVPAAGRLVALHAHNEAEVAARLAKRLAGGDRVAYVTDAGMPGISDPGERLVRAALDAGAGVEVVPGASAALAALVVSGLPTGRFAFEGFLPRKPASARVARLRALAAEDRTVVIYESPRRLLATLSDLAGICGPDRPVAVARELTKVFETVWRGTLGEAIVGNGGPEPRGEQVIVLGPRAEKQDVPEDVEVRAALTAELESGASVRDAASAVAGRLAISRRRAYELATRLRAQ